ncbi:unnamed protein product [Pleuronectes platessa]|uniref:Uncharacterized protein n=1 Tax=Pleuronectes platessa TaxID=8262 RepID=A0A9N7U513_PLEPL|nr:unnamed protein product [Pleuronectes platessa]
MDHTWQASPPRGKGDEQHRARAVSLPPSLRHLITMAGALRLPAEQVKRHPGFQSHRPSGAVSRAIMWSSLPLGENLRRPLFLSFMKSISTEGLRETLWLQLAAKEEPGHL